MVALQAEEFMNSVADCSGEFSNPVMRPVKILP